MIIFQDDYLQEDRFQEELFFKNYQDYFQEEYFHEANFQGYFSFVQRKNLLSGKIINRKIFK